MNKSILVLASLALLLGACVGKAPRDAEIALYDLGSLPAGEAKADLPVAMVEVRASSWLASPAQLYRLGYADDLRRRTYADSRWAAQPAEMLERALQRRIVFGQPDFTGPGCRLTLGLDEFEQRFTAADASKVVLEVRAALQPLRGDGLLAKRAFVIEKAAPTADARGDVVAARAATQALADEVGAWLAEVARERPQAVAVCRERK